MMVEIPTFITYSVIHHLGMFASKTIPQGTIIAQPKAFETIPFHEMQTDEILRGFWIPGQNGNILRLKGNLIFINHEENAAVELRKNGQLVTTHTVLQYQEITLNYRQTPICPKMARHILDLGGFIPSPRNQK